MNYQIQLQGLHCEACKKIAEKRIGKVEGVSSVTVGLEHQTAIVQTERAISQSEIEESIKDTEYKVIAMKKI